MAPFLAAWLAGCTAGPDIAAIATGGAAAALTANPAIGFAVGLATQAVADQVQIATLRRWQTTEQDAIATAAGPLEVGASTTWAVEHTVPIDEKHGEVEVTRVIDLPPAFCKEIVFSIASDDEQPHHLYTAMICGRGDGWKWASAEPATTRWGALQ